MCVPRSLPRWIATLARVPTFRESPQQDVKGSDSMMACGGDTGGNFDGGDTGGN